MTSVSGWGVLTPDLDFFWNAWTTHMSTIDLDGVDRTKGIPAIPQGNLEDSALEPFQRLRLAGQLSVCGKGQSILHVAPHIFRKLLEVPLRRLDPRNGSSVPHGRDVDMFVTNSRAGPATMPAFAGARR
jgi:hypothetical protein